MGRLRMIWIASALEACLGADWSAGSRSREDRSRLYWTKKQELQEEMARCQVRLASAMKLIGGLGGEEGDVDAEGAEEGGGVAAKGATVIRRRHRRR